LRWLAFMTMVPLPWTPRRWALPFLTVLAPSQRYADSKGRRHKTLTDWARQGILQIKRWLPDRLIVIVADSSFAAIDLIAAVRRHVCFVTRLRLDASLFEPAPERSPGQRGRPRKKGRKLPKLADVLADPATVWSTITMTQWYGGKRCDLQTATGTAVWYHAGLPPLPIRWVRGDPAPMVRSRHRPHHPGAVRTVLPRHPLGRRSQVRRRPPPPLVRLVHQTGPDLLGRHRHRTPRPVGRTAKPGFSDIPAKFGRRQNSRRHPQRPHRCAMLRDMNCAKSS
jgi:hypothetical protein